jgi:pimeloyl-ACP methyl ester carboxylesterase
MGVYAGAFGPHDPERTYVPHAYPEQLFDTGEVHINYATAGSPNLPALLLVPGQTESWWGYEEAMGLLAEHFQVFAVDLRGQGRSGRTPGRYTLDNIGNDLVRFIAGVVKRPALVAGLSSGGVLAAWLAAYAPPGQVVGAYLEDPPLFASEIRPEVGQSIDQAIGGLWELLAKYLGTQWSIGDWDAMVAAVPGELPDRLVFLAGMFGLGEAPRQSLKEYDPEWGHTFVTGSFYGGNKHSMMLAAAKVPVLFTHHFRLVDEATGALAGAISDLQATRVQQLITGAGQACTYVSFPEMGHSMHGQDPKLYATTLLDWAGTLPG